MAHFREYNRKIASLRSMARITRAMRMVSAGHLRRVQARLATARAYEAEVEAVRRRTGGGSAAPHGPAGSGGNLLLVVISSDRGLCGGFNHQLVRSVGAWLEREAGRWNLVRATFVGRRAWQGLRRQVEVRALHETVGRVPSLEDATRLGLECTALFEAGNYGRVMLARNAYLGGIRSESRIETLLPVAPPADAGGPAAADAEAALVEGDRADVARRLGARAVIARLYRAWAESAVAEHAARIAAMESASHNIDELVRDYTLKRNAARQGAITRDLNEVVSSAESLAG
jgi:F-type H+-transporting ATPase subunit gamma